MTATLRGAYWPEGVLTAHLEGGGRAVSTRTGHERRLRTTYPVSDMMLFTLWCCVALRMGLTLGLDTEVVVLRAARGREARLPCGQGRVFLDGPGSYVMWLKNDRDLLYRFPNEETERSRSERSFGTPCDGDACRDDTALLIKRVTEADGGAYRCRVHYQASPSVDYVIHVQLVDSPGTPRIYNEDMEEIKKGFIGPYSIGSDLTLICEVDDDQPDTLVYWRRNGEVIERAHSARPGVLRAEVRARGLTRAELDAHYECLATNADVTDPLAASVVVKMYLAPLSVEIRLNNNPDFEAGQPRVVDCVVIGCVPPPSVTWRLGDTLLRPTVHKELHDGNYTVSSLTLAPSVRDSGRRLACVAHNSHLPEQVFQEEVQLNVGYRPVCLTPREETLGAVPGQAETLACVVEADPEPMQFSWTFADSRTLYTSVKKVPGHPHRYASTLTWLPRGGDAGALQCRATNAFGEQKRACAYSVAAGGAPAAPACAVLRAYPDVLRVDCNKGWDGGRAQIVHLELYSASGAALHNSSNASGHFRVPLAGGSGGAGGGNLTAVVYASSERGRSPAKTIQLLQADAPFVASAAVREPSAEGGRGWSRWAQLSGGAAVALAAAAALALGVRAARRRGRGRGTAGQGPDLLPRSDGSFHREPDFAREERLLGTTNITVNQLASCANQYSASPVPACRVLVGCVPSPAPGRSPDACPAAQHSYFV